MVLIHRSVRCLPGQGALMAFKRRRQNQKRVSLAARITRLGSVVMTLAGTALVVALLITGGKWLSDNGNFPITKVNVEGGFEHVSPEQIRAAVMPSVGSGFFQLDVESIQATLGDLPWVDAVVVRKLWPDTLFVRVKEQTAMARWGEKGLLNRRGESFYPPLHTIDSGLPLLVGPEGSEKLVADHYKTTEALLRPLDISLSQLRYSARGSWQLEFVSGQIIMLGKEDVSQRMRRLATFYRELEASKPGASLLVVDMRYDTGIAARWQQPADCDATGSCQQASIKSHEGELVF